MLLAATRCPIATSAAASLAWFFDTRSKRRMGSPSVESSRMARKSASNVASLCVSVRRPSPERRTLPASSSIASRSARPQPIVLRASPVARARPRCRHGPPRALPPPQTDADHAHRGRRSKAGSESDPKSRRSFRRDRRSWPSREPHVTTKNLATKTDSFILGLSSGLIQLSR